MRKAYKARRRYPVTTHTAKGSGPRRALWMSHWHELSTWRWNPRKKAVGNRDFQHKHVSSILTPYNRSQSLTAQHTHHDMMYHAQLKVLEDWIICRFNAIKISYKGQNTNKFIGLKNFKTIEWHQKFQQTAIQSRDSTNDVTSALSRPIPVEFEWVPQLKWRVLTTSHVTPVQNADFICSHIQKVGWWQ